MKKLDLSSLPKLKPNPLFKGMQESLKDPKNFTKIEKQLTAILKADHTHKTVKAYVTCAWCNEKREERKKLMKEVGFKSIQQYMEWKKIMTIIKNKADFQLN